MLRLPTVRKSLELRDTLGERNQTKVIRVGIGRVYMWGCCCVCDVVSADALCCRKPGT